MKYADYLNTEFGRMMLVEEDSAITALRFDGEHADTTGLTMKETALIKEAKKQLNEYFLGSRKVFDLPLAPVGTEFQKEIWKALTTIPFGETRTYKQIADQVHRPKACRAVGMANHNNPIGIIIPCHRVVGSNGSLTGYAGGLDMKKRLLELET